MKERLWPEVTLISAAILASVLMFILGISVASHGGKNRFCDLVNATLAVPAPKPTNPDIDTAQYEIYLVHQRFMKIKMRYNCGQWSSP